MTNNTDSPNKTNRLGSEEQAEFFVILKNRFDKNMNRHVNLEWNNIQVNLESNKEKLWSLKQMEMTGGEPDVIEYDDKTGEYIFFDCSKESPKGRMSLCYDNEALQSRKENKPRSSAIGIATEMGIDILTEEQYHKLQSMGSFDMKTSSWIKTPFEIRKLGGAIFADFRYNHVFIYHNGAESYYSSRGFRGSLKV
jgi:hypothetical protein